MQLLRPVRLTSIADARSSSLYVQRRATCWEWARDHVLNRDSGKIEHYFPPDSKVGVLDQWKETLKSLNKDGLISGVPNFNSSVWHEFTKLVELRNLIVYAHISRPVKIEGSTVSFPQKLEQVPPGWPCQVFCNLASALHGCLGTSLPVWLVLPTS